MINNQFCTFIPFVTMTYIFIILYCHKLLQWHSVFAIVEIMFLHVHLNALLPSQYTLFLSYRLIYSEERHHHSNTTITSSGFLHMSGSVTVTTCFAVKFQHRGAPCILLKILRMESKWEKRNYLLESVILNLVFTSGSDLLCQTEHTGAHAECLFVFTCVCLWEGVACSMKCGWSFKISELSVLARWRRWSSAACVYPWPGQRQTEDLCHSERET